MPILTEVAVLGLVDTKSVSAITHALEAVSEVERVTVELVSGGESEINVFSHQPVAPEVLKQAVEDAGFTVADSAFEQKGVAEEASDEAAERAAFNETHSSNQ